MRRSSLLLTAALVWAQSAPAQSTSPSFQQPLPYPTPTPGIVAADRPGQPAQAGPAAQADADPPGFVKPVYIAPAQSLQVPGTGVPGLANAEKITRFDPRQLDLQNAHNHWLLVSGNTFIKDFGTRETDAREAVRLIQDLQLNELGKVGTPRPVMEYWLVDGKPPATVGQNHHPTPLEPNTLKVEQFGGQWWLRNRQRPLFNFGAHEDEARQAMAIIQRHGFNEVSWVGNPSPSMLVFLKNEAPNGRMEGPASLTPRSGSAGQESPYKYPGVVVPVQQQTGAIPHAPASGAGQYTLGNPAGDMRHATYTQQQEVGQNQYFRPVTHVSARPQTMMETPGQGIGPVDLRHQSFVQPEAPPTSNVLPQGGTPSASTAAAQLNAHVMHIPVDYRRVQVRRDNKEWKLYAGNYVVANFGLDEVEARKAMDVLTHYRVSEQCVLGHPQPVLSYFLSNGKAPHGILPGITNVQFEGNNLAVKPAEGGWAVYNGTNVLVPCGQNRADALEALQTLQQYKFDEMCKIGQGDQGLTIFVRSH